MKNNKLLYLLIIILVIWNVILTSVSFNDSESKPTEIITTTNVTGFSTDLTKVVGTTKSKCVTVESGNSIGSGVIYLTIDNKFYVVTALHTIDKPNSIKVTLASSKELNATLLGKDEYSDIALLEVESDLQVYAINKGNSNLLKDGEFLMYVGTPTSKEFSLSSGLALVSSKLRTITNSIRVNNKVYEYYDSYIQLNADVSNGNSGSPLFNMNGEFVGLITMKDASSVLAVPANKIDYIVNDLMNEEHPTKLMLGINPKFISELENYEKNNLNVSLDVNYGMYVLNTKLNSIASTLGIKQGDIILSINDTKIIDYSDYLKIVYSGATDISVTLLRNNEEIKVTGSIN